MLQFVLLLPLLLLLVVQLLPLGRSMLRLKLLIRGPLRCTVLSFVSVFFVARPPRRCMLASSTFECLASRRSLHILICVRVSFRRKEAGLLTSATRSANVSVFSVYPCRRMMLLYGQEGNACNTKESKSNSNHEKCGSNTAY
jgi:hypothetical protein